MAGPTGSPGAVATYRKSCLHGRRQWTVSSRSPGRKVVDRCCASKTRSSPCPVRRASFLRRVFGKCDRVLHSLVHQLYRYSEDGLSNPRVVAAANSRFAGAVSRKLAGGRNALSDRARRGSRGGIERRHSSLDDSDGDRGRHGPWDHGSLELAFDRGNPAAASHLLFTTTQIRDQAKTGGGQRSESVGKDRSVFARTLGRHAAIATAESHRHTRQKVCPPRGRGSQIPDPAASA